jgi:hypothetical protein
LWGEPYQCSKANRMALELRPGTSSM